MAKIVHRRFVTRPAAPEPASTHAPDAALDNLTFIGWASAVFAISTLIVQLMPLTSDGALSDANRLTAIVTALRAAAASAAIGLPAALELGLPGARHRTPWLYRGAVLLALAQLLVFGLGQLQRRVLTDADVADPSSPLVLAFSIGALGAAILQVAGTWSFADGLADLGARPRRAFLVGLPVLAVAALLGGYIPSLIEYIPAGVEQNGVASVALVVLRAVVGTVQVALTVALGVRLIDGATRRLRPTRAWRVGAIAGASLVASSVLFAVFVDLSWAIQVLRDASLFDLLTPLTLLLRLTEMLGWVLLVSALAAGLGRAALIDVAPRRYLTRWVRYPA